MLVQHQDQLLGSGSKVVITSTKIKTASARGTRSKCFKPLISIILKPIGISNLQKIVGYTLLMNLNLKVLLVK
jgi:hypothetical protein